MSLVHWILENDGQFDLADLESGWKNLITRAEEEKQKFNEMVLNLNLDQG